MALDTFANLKTDIAGWLKRDDLTTYIPSFITLAEEAHRADVRIKEMVSRDAITVNARQINLPTGFLEPITFRLLTTPVTVLKYVNPDNMNKYRQESTGQPEWFTFFGPEIEFDVAPDSSYSGEIVYYKAETALSDSNTTNNILTNAPSTYLYGSLLQAEPFLKNDERLALWTIMYDRSIGRLDKLRKRQRRGSPQVARPAGDTP